MTFDPTKKRGTVWVLVMVTSTVTLVAPQAFPASVAEAATQLDYSVVVIQFDGIIPDDASERVLAAGGEVEAVYEDYAIVIATLDNATEFDAFQAAMASYDDVEHALPQTYLQPLFTPNDPWYTLQWGPARVGAEVAWNDGVGSKQTGLAIIDFGVFCGHEDLDGNCDYDNSTAADRTDFCRHGTDVAGVAAAVTNNELGIAGISQSRMLPVADPSAQAACVYTPVQVAALVDEARAHARILSLSLGGTGCYDNPLICIPMEEAIERAYDDGLLIVAAAGNYLNCEDDLIFFPAVYPEVIAVGASNQLDQRWVGSACGPELDLMAPGDNITSTCLPDEENPNLYCVNGAGTSFAAPFVSGSAALIWELCPHLSRQDLWAALNQTAESLGLPAREQGHGLVRLDLALEQAKLNPTCP